MSKNAIAKIKPFFLIRKFCFLKIAFLKKFVFRINLLSEP